MLLIIIITLMLIIMMLIINNAKSLAFVQNDTICIRVTNTCSKVENSMKKKNRKYCGK